MKQVEASLGEVERKVGEVGMLDLSMNISNLMKVSHNSKKYAAYFL